VSLGKGVKKLGRISNRKIVQALLLDMGMWITCDIPGVGPKFIQIFFKTSAIFKICPQILSAIFSNFFLFLEKTCVCSTGNKLN